MLKAKLDSVRKNKKGFSLVELIIVIAIMVALIAVMAPAFVKYVQKSRDAALATAAEDLEKTVQTFFGDPDCDYSIPSDGRILVIVDGGKLSVTANDAMDATGTYNETADVKLIDAIKDTAGCDEEKNMGKTDFTYLIHISQSGQNASIKMYDNEGVVADALTLESTPWA